jgi:chromosomal replication initiation ATPase DnaA
VIFDIHTESSLIIRQNINLFLNSNDKFFLVTAQGGTGKSHLLRENGFQVQRDYPNIFVKLLTPGAFAGVQSCELELDEQKKYLILIDDADVYLEKILDFLLFVKQCRSNIQVILSVRQSGLSELQVELDEQKLSEYIFKEPYWIQ